MKFKLVAVIAGLCLFAASFPAHAQVLKLRKTGAAEQAKNLAESLTLKGDLRLRHETTNRRSGGNAARQRQRFRLRLDGVVALPHDLSVGIQLGSGAGEQTSQNQSFDNLGSRKGIYISRAYMSWSPKGFPVGSLSLTGGKFKNPLWQVYSSDALFDTDVNPEGFAQSFTWKTGSGPSLFVNAMQFPVDEDSTSEADQWLFSQQAGIRTDLPGNSRLSVAAAWHEWVNERRSTFGQAAILEGNRRVASGPGAGSLANEFSVVELTGDLSVSAGKIPVHLQGTFLKNTAALPVRPTAGDRHREDLGYQIGAIVGGAKKAGRWEAAYFRKWVETDATVADLADADFGDGGTNRRGHIFWAAYAPLDWIQIKAKHMLTQVINEGLAPLEDDINKFQLDLVVRF